MTNFFNSFLDPVFIRVGIDDKLVMIAAHGMEPGASDEFEGAFGIRSAIHQITQENDFASVGWDNGFTIYLIAKFIQQHYQFIVTAVNVADPGGVPDDPAALPRPDERPSRIA